MDFSSQLLSVLGGDDSSQEEPSLSLVREQTNLTKGDTWLIDFYTQGQADLEVFPNEKTIYNQDIQFLGFACGQEQLKSAEELADGHLALADYACSEKSTLTVKALTAGVHKIIFLFGQTTAIAKNFACDSGTLNDTCYVTSSQAIADSDTLAGTGSLIIQSGGSLTSTATEAFTIAMDGDVTIESGGSIAGNLTNLSAANLDVQAGGSINVNGLGYAGGNFGTGDGPGGGGYTLVSGYYYGGGGAYGGNGGRSIQAAASGGSAYGSTTEPTDFGSGGGGGDLTADGGGAVKITVTGTTTISGTITADGTDPTCGSVRRFGGAAGGSIFIITNVLDGTGTTTANGSTGCPSWGGGGSGGRIAIYYTADSSSLKMENHAGAAGYQNGAAGTIFLKDSAVAYGSLIVDNHAINGLNTPIVATTTPISYSNLTIKNYGKYEVPTSTTITAQAFSNGSQTGSLIINGTINLPAATASLGSSHPGVWILGPSGTINNFDSAVAMASNISFVSGNTITAITSLTLNGASFTNDSSLPNLTSLSLADVATVQNNGSFDAITSLTVASSTFYQDGTLASLADLTIGSGGIFEFQNLSTSTSFALDSITIQLGGVLTHQANATSHLDSLNLVLDSLDVQSGGMIYLKGRGYAGGNGDIGEGPGGGGNVFTGGYYYGGGGAYGGNGGDSSIGTALGGTSYGSSTRPTDLGSGGGGSDGAAGGGALELTVSGTTTIDGIISADATSSSCTSRDGGGAGGSIYIKTNILAGSGTTTANGSPGCSAYGGGGGGGRIALYATSSSFSGVTTVKGGAAGYDAGEDGSTSQDFSPPTSHLNNICSIADNDCSSAGEAASPQEAYSLNSLTGTSTDAGLGVKIVQISLQESGSAQWYDASLNTFSVGSENWISVSGTSSWSYDISAVPFDFGETYVLRSQAIDEVLFVESSPPSLSFKYMNYAPTVSNVTVTSSGQTITYDTTDAESTTTNNYFFYDIGATLNENLSATDTTAVTVSNLDYFPSAGTILLDDEMISYTATSSSDLAGIISRGADNSTSSLHASGITVWIKGVSLSGDIGSNVATGTDRTITWDPYTDLPDFYSTTTKARVLADDGFPEDNIHSAESSAFTVDTAFPVLSSISVGDITTDSATITWTTNELATSSVEYSTVSGFSSGTSSTSEALSLSHSLIISSLTSNTTYYYRVGSADPFSNLTTSSESSFDTLAGTSDTPQAVVVVYPSLPASAEEAEQSLDIEATTTLPLIFNLQQSLRIFSRMPIEQLIPNDLLEPRPLAEPVLAAPEEQSQEPSGTQTQNSQPETKGGPSEAGSQASQAIALPEKKDEAGGVLQVLTDQMAEILNSPAVSVVKKTAKTSGLVVAASNAFSTFVAGPLFSFNDLTLRLARLWSSLLMFFGIKKRRRPWGTVYDSRTKQPLDPVYVTLKSSQGKEVETAITDLDGRYGFLVNPGEYMLEAHKTNYLFPSKKISAGTVDNIYEDPYLGGKLEITSPQEVLLKNIPMDPEGLDWNELAKKRKNLMAFYSKADIFLASWPMAFLFVIGFAVSVFATIAHFSWYSVLISGCYFVFGSLGRILPGQKTRGRVTNKNTGEPLSFALVEVYTLSRKQKILQKVCDQLGRFYCLISPGQYHLEIKQRKPDGSYSLIGAKERVKAKSGIIKEHFKV